MAGIIDPKIVTDGLIFHVDAADANSYPRTGTTWKDLSINNYSGTMTNGPTFSNDARGSIVFDGVNDYVDFGVSTLNQNFSSTFTTCMWIKPTAIPISGGAPMAVFGKSDLSCGGYGSIFYISCDLQVNMLAWSSNCPGGGLTNSSVYAAVTQNVWNFITFAWSYVAGQSYISFYSGKTLIFSDVPFFSSSPITFNNSATFKIGTPGTGTVYQGGSCGGAFTTPSYFNGSIASISVYSTKLTADDVTRNYNATKTRFGLGL